MELSCARVSVGNLPNISKHCLNRPPTKLPTRLSRSHETDPGVSRSMVVLFWMTTRMAAVITMPSYTVHNNTDYFGNNIGQGIASSVASCAALCLVGNANAFVMVCAIYLCVKTGEPEVCCRELEWYNDTKSDCQTIF